MKKNLSILVAALLSIFAANAQTGNVAIVAHRGFWKSTEAQGAENSIASLKAAQDYGFYGSEFDVYLTKDDIIVVNHDEIFHGMDIRENTYADLVKKGKLVNGEVLPTLESYFEQGVTSKGTVLIFELKKELTEEKNMLLVDKGIELLKKYDLFDPSRVVFISFGYSICQKIAKDAPLFSNQYLRGDKSPAECEADGINGIDYEHDVLSAHPEWVTEAHRRGMLVNAWTVNTEEKMKEMIALGVDIITTDEPVLLRRVLGQNEVHVIE